MSESILDSTKNALDVPEDYTVFDPNIIMHINTVFNKLNQLGIGPEHGFQIEDSDSTWEDFLSNRILYNAVKSYMVLNVRLLFDPPGTSYHIQAIKEQIQELEWRLNVQREMGSTTLLGGIRKLTGNVGDEHKIRLANPTGQDLIKPGATFEVEFRTPNGRRRDYGTLDLTQVATGVLTLSIVIQTGTYTVRSLSPRRTILVLEVTAQ